MKPTTIVLAALAFLTIGAASAQAAEHSMKMSDCCKHCCDEHGKGHQTPAEAPQPK